MARSWMDVNHPIAITAPSHQAEEALPQEPSLQRILGQACRAFQDEAIA